MTLPLTLLALVALPWHFLADLPQPTTPAGAPQSGSHTSNVNHLLPHPGDRFSKDHRLPQSD